MKVLGFNMRIVFQNLFMLLILFIFSCNEGLHSGNIPLIVKITNDEGDPLLGAKIQINNQITELANSAGLVRTTLQGVEGSSVELTLDCPPAYLPVGSTKRNIVFRFLYRNKTLAPLHESFICRSTKKNHVLVVRTDGRKNLPILVTGKPQGETNSMGVAQIPITGSAGDEVDIVIDTGAHSALRPPNPSRRIQLPLKSKFIIFDQKFSNEKEAPKIKRKKRKTRLGPRRL